MNKYIEQRNLAIEDMDITVRAKNVLKALDVHTIADLHLMYLLNTIPKAKTIIKYYPYINIELAYSKKINEEVKELLRVYCGVEELDHVGV
jgi:hypothetical protein